MKLDINVTPPCSDIKLAPPGPCLNIPKGTTKVMTINLSELNVGTEPGQSWVMFTIVDDALRKVTEVKLTKKGANQIVFNDAFTSKLRSNKIYYYDLMEFYDETHRKQLISPSAIWVSATVGGK